MKRTKKVLSIIVLIITMAVSASLFSACNAKVSDSVFAFGTVSEISLKGKKAKNTIKSIDSLFTRLDVLFDAENEKSDVYKINHADKDVILQVSPETYELLKLAKTAYSETDKTFNVATYPFSKLWRFTSDTFTGNVTSLPSDEQIKDALLSANLDSLTLLTDNRVMKTDKDLSLSFGAIAKGFAGDAAIENVIKDGQNGILNVGGTIFTVGSGEYKIGISSPRDTAADYFAKLTLSGGAVVCTSGDYERYYIFDGKRYCHIIGRDGYPVDNGIISVTIISKDRNALSGAMCDVLSTAVFALGRDKGVEYAKKYGAGLVIIYADNTFETFNVDSFELKDNSYSKR